MGDMMRKILGQKLKKKADKTPWDDVVTTYLGIGVVWGIALAKSRLVEPTRIRDQFLFTDFALLKFVLGAVSVSQFGFAAMASIKMFELKDQFRATRQNSSGSTLRTPIAQLVAGSCLVGVGMALAGSSPATAAAQLGGGLSSATHAIGGGLLGALLFGYLKHFILVIFPARKVVDFSMETIDRDIGLPYNQAAAVGAAVMLVLVVLLEIAFPWRSPTEAMLAKMGPMPAPSTHYSYLSDSKWIPGACGALAGLCQLPAAHMLGKVLDAHSAYASIAAQLTHVVPSPAKAFEPARWGVDNVWQVFFVAGIGIGAWVSNLLTTTPLPLTQGAELVDPLQRVLGGFLAVVGSHLAVGGFESHGMGGVAVLSTKSCMAFVVTFAAGTITTLLGFAG